MITCLLHHYVVHGSGDRGVSVPVYIYAEDPGFESQRSH